MSEELSKLLEDSSLLYAVGLISVSTATLKNKHERCAVFNLVTAVVMIHLISN